MKHAYVHGIGLAAPGLPDWPTAQPVLRGDAPYQADEPLPAFRTTRLPRNEARRMGAATKLAFRVAEQACGETDVSSVATVFASAAADVSIADRNCTAISSPGRAISPTHFHNSVHNAATGYWGIATGSREPANSLSGGRDSFAVALCEAWASLAMEDKPVLMVCFDTVGSGMLQDAWRDIHDTLGVALLLSRQPQGALAGLSRPRVTENTATSMADDQLEHFRQCNPAAHALPLLTALAQTGEQTVTVASGQGNLDVAVRCPS